MLVLRIVMITIVSFLSTPSFAQSPSETLVKTAFHWETNAEVVTLEQAGRFVLRYEFKSGTKPIVYPIAAPIIGDALVGITRDFPMKKAEQKGTKDHVHHRSLWMTHGDVNGFDFWLEEENGAHIDHVDVVSAEANDEAASLTTTANWVTPDGTILLRERRKMVVSGEANARSIDFQIDLTAQDEDVVFGDTKEGSFGVRVPDAMAVDAKLGGTIINQHGDRNDDAWGKRASWVDYSGPVGDSTAGITILEHPDSYGHPCRWHVRTYGLFAANPFGEHHFTGEKASKEHRLKSGETMHLRYQLVLHEGDADVEAINKQWGAYSDDVAQYRD